MRYQVTIPGENTVKWTGEQAKIAAVICSKSVPTKEKNMQLQQR